MTALLIAKNVNPNTNARATLIADKIAHPSSTCLRSSLAAFPIVLLAVIWLFPPVHATDDVKVSAPSFYIGAYDGSAAVALNTNLFVTASDEDSTLRVYRREQGGTPLQTIDLGSFLRVDSAHPETDIEAAARIGNRIYWISSHGRNQNGKARLEHQRFFATEIQTDGPIIKIVPVGQPYENLLSDLCHATNLASFNLADAANRAPKIPNGLSIEGLCGTSESNLLIGFRSPIPNGQALMVPLLNPSEVINGTPARLGAPIQLDLDGLGIRDIAYWQGEYLIVAGPADGNGHSHLFQWRGIGKKPKAFKHISLHGLNPEGIVIYPNEGLRTFQVLSDDSSQAKNSFLPMFRTKSFRSVWITP